MTTYLIQLLFGATLLLLVAIVSNALLYKAAASLRYRVWMFTLLGLLALPVLSPMLPHWSLGVVEYNEPRTLESELIDRPARAQDLAQGNALGNLEPFQPAALQGQDTLSCPVGAAEFREQIDTQGGGEYALPWARYRALAGRIVGNDTDAQKVSFLLTIWLLGTTMLLFHWGISILRVRKMIAMYEAVSDPVGVLAETCGYTRKFRYVTLPALFCVHKSRNETKWNDGQLFRFTDNPPFVP